jgi:hypothetical protein
MKYEEHINKGIDFLYQSQNSEGSFPDCVYLIEKGCWVEAKPTVFSTSLIAHSIAEIIKQKNLLNEDAYNKCILMRKKFFDFFIKEMAMPGLWKFGIGEDDNWGKLPCDVDDTCCVSFLLKDYHPYIRFGLNKSLILKNRNKEGLFKTWFLSSPVAEMNPVDSVVNVNALLYLGELDSTANVTHYLCGLINNNNEEGSFYYYIDALCLYFMMSRAYSAGVKGLMECSEVLERKIIKKEAEINNELFTAAAIISLINFGIGGEFDFDIKIKSISDRQKKDGGWLRYPFYQGEEYPKPAGVQFGSECITTAFCAEAILKYLNSNNKQ